jgi:hypothetical protein
MLLLDQTLGKTAQLEEFLLGYAEYETSSQCFASDQKLKMSYVTCHIAPPQYDI